VETLSKPPTNYRKLAARSFIHGLKKIEVPFNDFLAKQLLFFF
jgi:hypothetical protein